MTEDEKRLAEVEARVLETFAGTDEGRISRADFEFLLNSRQAWKFTAKCFAAESRDAP
jgi:hypothetical protein